jgi:pimeloyl-ACP methyl ester carboxylesterase
MAVLAPNPRYLTGGSGPPLVMLHTVRTQAEHFRHLIPLVEQGYTLYALDLPGMGYSQVVPEASYAEPAMRAAVKRLVTQLDLRDVTLLGEPMGAVLALTTAVDLPDRIQRLVAINTYAHADGIARSSLLARLIITGIIAPGLGPRLARVEPRPVMRAVLSGGLTDPTALRDDYLDELLAVGRHPDYATVARAVYRSLPRLVAARARYPGGHRTGAPHLRRERLVPTLRPRGHQATAPIPRVRTRPQGRPLHRPGTARLASHPAQHSGLTGAAESSGG